MKKVDQMEAAWRETQPLDSVRGLPSFSCVRIGQFMIEDGSELVEEIASVLNEVEPV